MCEKPDKLMFGYFMTDETETVTEREWMKVERETEWGKTEDLWGKDRSRWSDSLYYTYKLIA